MANERGHSRLIRFSSPKRAIRALFTQPASNRPTTRDLRSSVEEVAKEATAGRAGATENPNQATINLGLSLIKDSENHDTLGKLSRYEAGLLNAITRTLSLLHSLQKSELLSR